MNAGYRRAALALSALNKDDRAWILENLSSDERIPLATLLTDLERQGIKVPVSEVATLLQKDPGTDEQEPVPVVAITPRERLAEMPVREVFRVLSHEPDWLVGMICGMAKWRWLRAPTGSPRPRFRRSKAVPSIT